MTHYDVLSVAPTATLEQIKKARRDAAQLYHPDRLQQMGESVRALAEDQLKKINAAYDVLSDPEKRRVYDASLNITQTSRAASQRSAAAAKQQAASTRNTCDTSSTAGGTPPPRSERHTQAWSALRAAQRRRWHRFWVGTVLSSIALFFTLVVLLVAVANTWIPAPPAVPRPMWLGMLGVLMQLVALAGVARVAHVVYGGEIVRFAAGMLVPALGTWLLVALLGTGVLLIGSSAAALRVVFVVPIMAHLLFCVWRVRRAVVRLDRAEQMRLLWHPV